MQGLKLIKLKKKHEHQFLINLMLNNEIEKKINFKNKLIKTS